MSLSTREQLVAFLALIFAILVLGLAPVIVAGILGRTLPDSLVAVSDKTVTGLVGVLGTIAALVFRTNKVDEARADNTAKAFDAITATANAVPAAPVPVVVQQPENEPVPVETQP
jgi:multisubunit Na+/H+ antiporter MnhF subunit